MNASHVQPAGAQRGFTLVEVLVALAIVAVAFVAMFASVRSVLESTISMQERTFANWVAYDRITELRVSDEWPEGDRATGEVEMADTTWRYTLIFNPTQDEAIRQVIVRVATETEPDRVLAEATGVIYRQAAGGPGGATGNFGNSGDVLIPAPPAEGGGELPGLQPPPDDGDPFR